MNSTDARMGSRCRGLRLLAAAGVAVAVAACHPLAGGAQAGEGGGAPDPGSPWRAGVGAGWSYYSLVSRGDAGTVVSAVGSYTPTPRLRVEAGVRTMRCADCFRFVMAEGGVQLRLPLGHWAPFLAAGAGVTSDPEFVGTREHLYAGVGTTREPRDRPWGIQLEVRGRQLDPGNRLVEVSLGLTFGKRGTEDPPPEAGNR
jgi:hypothetical protein